MMMNMEQRHGSQKFVIRKAPWARRKALQGFRENRDVWAIKTSFVFPGAIQYYGPDEVCNQPTQTLLQRSKACREGEVRARPPPRQPRKPTSSAKVRCQKQAAKADKPAQGSAAKSRGESRQARQGSHSKKPR